MPTLKKRINLALPKEMEKILGRLAERDGVPLATKALELICKAVEIEEDEVWDTIVKKRDTNNAEFIPHDSVWV